MSLSDDRVMIAAGYSRQALDRLFEQIKAFEGQFQVEAWVPRKRFDQGDTWR